MDQLGVHRESGRTQGMRAARGTRPSDSTHSLRSTSSPNRNLNGGLSEAEALRIATEESTRQRENSTQSRPTNAPLIDFMSEEPELFYQPGTSIPSVNGRLTNKLWSSDNPGQLNNSCNPTMELSNAFADTNQYLNNASFGPFHDNVLLTSVSNQPFNPKQIQHFTNYSADLPFNNPGRVQEPNNSYIHSCNNYNDTTNYARLETQMTSLSNVNATPTIPNSRFTDSNPFLINQNNITNDSMHSKNLVDLRPQSLLSDPFAAKPSIDPFAEPGEESSVRFGNSTQTDVSLFQLQLEKTKRDENLFK